MPKARKGDREKAEKYERARMLANARAQRYKARKTEEQLEKKKEQDRKSAKERSKLVKDMSCKEKKEARKKWRDRKRALRKRKKDAENVLSNTPISDNDEHLIPGNIETPRSRQKETGKKLARRNRAKALKELKDKKEEVEKLKRKVQKYKKRFEREKKKNKLVSNVSPSPRKKLQVLLGKERVSPGVKKQLFSGLVLERQLKSQAQAVCPKSKLRQQMVKAVGNNFLKKYRMQTRYKSIVPHNYKTVLMQQDKPSLKYERKLYNTEKIKEALKIRQFFEDDMVSRMMPGKNDFVKRGTVRMQKRILLDSMFNLYGKFLQETNLTTISRSVFYRSRPWWVFRPQGKDRETCACIKHENTAFLFTALKHAKVVAYKDLSELLKTTVCSTKNEKCMIGVCPTCKTSPAHRLYYDIGLDEEIKYNKWETITEVKNIKGVSKPIKFVNKSSLSGKKSHVLNIFKKDLCLFKKHVFNMHHQAAALKMLKEKPKEKNILFQVDFSQNYVAKFSTEIQSVHFGASQKQISLHTGAMYVKTPKEVLCSTFCTVSDNLDHHAHGVWSHMKEILVKCQNDYPNTKCVHFFTDGPTSQYKNKTNVFLMKLLLPQYFPNLQSFTWNYSEPGHGKGVMDGVGGSIKRLTDRHVLHQQDVTSAKDLVNLHSNGKTKVIEVSSTTFDEMKSMIPPELETIVGIMSVRQITWAKENDMLHFRKLSCFECPFQEACKHYQLFSIDADGNRVLKETPPSKKKEIQNIKKKNQRKPTCQKKKILKVSDVYSSEEEDTQEKVSLKTNFEFEDLNPGTFVIITFETEGKKSLLKDYVAVIQNVENICEREVIVTFMKKYNKDSSTFVMDEDDESYVSIDQIRGLLPTPEMIFKGDRLLQKFEGPVPFV